MVSTEKLLQRLDMQWRLRCIPNLPEMLREYSNREFEGPVELCAADLEWRWRTAEMRLTSPSTNAHDIDRRPKAEAYAPLLGDHWSLAPCKQRMLEAEWIVRNAWGDSPSIDCFARQNELEESVIESMIGQLNLISTVAITVSHPEGEIELFDQHSLTIGRQRMREPASPTWIPEKKRLIVANKAHTNISREQIRLRRVSAWYFEVKNISESVSLKLAHGVLRAGESIQARLPYEFSINNLRISIFVDSD